MKTTQIRRMRGFSFAIPALMDGMFAMVQVALPLLLTVRFNASSLFIGNLNSGAQAVRLPLCLGAGTLSEKIGRTRVIYPAALIAAFSCMGLALAGNSMQVVPLYVLLVASMGGFYPALQAFIGGRSPQGELRKNLSAFNVGWTVGGSAFGLVSGYLLAASRPLPFLLGGLLAVGSLLFVVAWSRSRTGACPTGDEADGQPAASGPGPLLVVARVGHFLGFFSYASARSLFPKLGVQLGFHVGEIGFLVGLLLVGQALGIFLSSAGPWWRGRLWPQILAQGMVLVSGIVVFLASSRYLIAGAFVVQGIGLSIAYTAALYYGLQARTNMGMNTGIHESLVAAGNIAGSFAAGAAAQFLSPRAPYAVIAVLSSAVLLFSLTYWRIGAPPRQHHP